MKNTMKLFVIILMLGLPGLTIAATKLDKESSAKDTQETAKQKSKEVILSIILANVAAYGSGIIYPTVTNYISKEDRLHQKYLGYHRIALNDSERKEIKEFFLDGTRVRNSADHDKYKKKTDDAALIDKTHRNAVLYGLGLAATVGLSVFCNIKISQNFA